jgi:NAD-dependent SIR2 family protein deacetylase
MYDEFIQSEDARQRYWARAVVGWESFISAQPNPAHVALAKLEDEGLVRGLITQNVDRLHERAGSASPIELHGSLYEVYCLDCGAESNRQKLHDKLMAANPEWPIHTDEVAPDGDAVVDADRIDSFSVAYCEACGGPLKPKVVFFGESVPIETKEAAFEAVDRAKSLLVVGSSLAVYSGYRFLRHAHREGYPAAAINLGPMKRGMDMLDVFVDGRAGETLKTICEQLDIASIQAPSNDRFLRAE